MEQLSAGPCLAHHAGCQQQRPVMEIMPERQLLFEFPCSLSVQTTLRTLYVVQAEAPYIEPCLSLTIHLTEMVCNLFIDMSLIDQHPLRVKACSNRARMFVINICHIIDQIRMRDMLHHIEHPRCILPIQVLVEEQRETGNHILLYQLDKHTYLLHIDIL